MQFEATMAGFILANCVTMGIEAEMRLGGAADWEDFCRVSEHVFTAIFLLELILRVQALGWRSFLPVHGTGSIWPLGNFLDGLLVLVTGVLVMWILPAMGLNHGSFLQTMTVLRACRLVRLIRVVQQVQFFREVLLILRGLSQSARVLFWTSVVIFFITYIFAIFGTVLISTEIKQQYDDAIDSAYGVDSDLLQLVEFTGGVFQWMFTLVQVLTLDSWTSIARPLMKHVWWSWSFFYLYVAIAVFVLMNLVTAIIVDNALSSSKKDSEDLLEQKDREKTLALKQFRGLFELMDEDGNGEVSRSEFEHAFEDPVLSTRLRLLDIEPSACQEIFGLLDSGDGHLSLEEFFEGITKMEGGAQAKDLFRVLKTAELSMKIMCQHSNEVAEDLNELLKATPGARGRNRSGTLRSRCKKQNCEEFFMTDSASVDSAGTALYGRPGSGQFGSPSPSGQFLQQWPRSPSLPPTLEASAPPPDGGLPDGLGEVLKKLDEVVAAVGLCTRGVNACNARIDNLSGQIEDVKNNALSARTGKWNICVADTVQVQRAAPDIILYGE